MNLPSSQATSDSSAARLKKPPNYSSKGVQLRLMMLVGSLLLVIVLMSEARKPETWSWMGFGNDESNLNSDGESASDGTVDSRLYRSDDGPSEPLVSYQDADSQGNSGRADSSAANQQTSSDGDDSDSNLIDDIRQDDVVSSDQNDDGDQASVSERDGAETLLARTRFDFWSKCYEKLAPEERTLLFVGMRQLRENGAVSDESASEWQSLMMHVREERLEYQATILQSISSLEFEDEVKRRLWSAVLLDLQNLWSDLEEVLLAESSEPSTDQQESATDGLQVVLDEIAFSFVTDDAVTSRRSEQEAWYRQFERVQKLISIDELQERLQQQTRSGNVDDEPDDDARIVEFTPVGFLQLFEQPDDFRGKPIQIRGEIKLVESKPATENEYGIDGYHVFWIRPEGKSNLPIVVYALDRPDGFPEYRDDHRIEFGQGEGEPVVVNGIFFKRRAYEAQDGTRLYPLIIANTVSWTPLDHESERTSTTPSLPIAVSIIALVGLAAFAIARVAIWNAGRVKSGGFQMPSLQDDESTSKEFLLAMQENHDVLDPQQEGAARETKPDRNESTDGPASLTGEDSDSTGEDDKAI